MCLQINKQRNTQKMKPFKVKFGAKNLTGNAGLVNFGKFAKKLQLPKTLERMITIQRGHTADYSIADVVMILIMGALGGIKHISHLSILRCDSVIRKLFGWAKFPDNRTFSRIFALFNHKYCNELHEAETIIRPKVWSKKWFGRVTLDLDSTVIGVNGSQEGAEKGYNPKGAKKLPPFIMLHSRNKRMSS